MRWLIGLTLFLLALGMLRVVGCGDESPCGDCNDGNPCTRDVCDSYNTSGTISCDPEDISYRCVHPRVPDGAPCGSGNICVGGACVENPCADCEDDGNDCTIDCDYETGACEYVPLPDGTQCTGIRLSGECVSGVCIVCEELNCDDGDLCTVDFCDPAYGGCLHGPVFCWDGDRCEVCDPETGECSEALAEGHWCEANREIGLDGTYLHGSCESGRCTGQPCDLTSEEVYPCPVEQDPTTLNDWVCCPGGGLHVYYPRGYCFTDSGCDLALRRDICWTECPDTETNPRRYDECWSYADGDCALVDYCHAECASYPTHCMQQDGVCPSP
jgi:hypothetical protein